MKVSAISISVPKSVKQVVKAAAVSLPILGGLESCSMVLYDPFLTPPPPRPVYRYVPTPPPHHPPIIHRPPAPRGRFYGLNEVEINDTLVLNSWGSANDLAILGYSQK